MLEAVCCGGDSVAPVYANSDGGVDSDRPAAANGSNCAANAVSAFRLPTESETGIPVAVEVDTAFVNSKAIDVEGVTKGAVPSIDGSAAAISCSISASAEGEEPVVFRLEVEAGQAKVDKLSGTGVGSSVLGFAYCVASPCRVITERSAAVGES